MMVTLDPQLPNFRQYIDRETEVKLALAVFPPFFGGVSCDLGSVPFAERRGPRRLHKTRRVTPAMAANVTDRVWSLEELVERTSN
jgi:hypothetical protein